MTTERASTVEVTEENFAETVGQGTVLLDFWAAWCGPCRAFAPVFEAAATKHPGVVFGKVNTEAAPGLAAAFQIRAIPTLVIIRDGVLLGAQAGMLSAAALEDLIERVNEIDMDDVREKIRQADEAAGSDAEPSAEVA